MLTILIFLIVLAVLVFIHELGHFTAAKKVGIRVDEFALGFPPKLWAKKIGETLYSINLIPFGGFVKIFGENPDDESINGPDKERSFVHKAKWKQAIVLVAGVAFNFIFAWMLIVAAFTSGVPASLQDYAGYTDRITDPRVIVTSVTPDSPAAVAGLKAGDVIKELHSPLPVVTQAGPVIAMMYLRDTNDAISIDAIQTVVNQAGENDITVVYGRGDATSSLMVKPVKGLVEERYAIGISMDNVGTLKLPIHLALWEGSIYTLHMIKATAVGLGQFVGQIFHGTANFAAVSGPVGIASLVGDASKLGVNYLLMFIALISINLGVINLVPFPALDGGRLLFVAIEAIIRKPIKPVVANTVNAAGFALLLLLMLVVTYKDIVNKFF